MKGSEEMADMLNLDGPVNSRHSGKDRSPGGLQLFEKTGFRLSPE